MCHETFQLEHTVRARDLVVAGKQTRHQVQEYLICGSSSFKPVRPLAWCVYCTRGSARGQERRWLHPASTWRYRPCRGSCHHDLVLHGDGEVECLRYLMHRSSKHEHSRNIEALQRKVLTLETCSFRVSARWLLTATRTRERRTWQRQSSLPSLCNPSRSSSKSKHACQSFSVFLTEPLPPCTPSDCCHHASSSRTHGRAQRNRSGRMVAQLRPSVTRQSQPVKTPKRTRNQRWLA